ncbi:YciI family protein [Monashia sp. NPDC004114]
MPIFAIHYTYPDDATEMLTIRPEHREWLTSLPGLLVGGMYKDGVDEVSEGEPTDQEASNAALIVVSGESVEDVTAVFDQDPYWLGGYVLRRVIRLWDPPLGPWVADPTNSPA